MFPDAELRRAQEDVLVTLPDRCDLLEATRTADGTGGWTEAWNVTRADVPCRLDYKSGGVGQQGGAPNIFIYQALTVPASITLEEFTRFQVDGVAYYVRGPLEGSGQIVHRYNVVKVDE